LSIGLGSEQADGCDAAAIDCDFARRDTREIPGEARVGSRAFLRGCEVARLLRLLPQLEQLDELRCEVGPELPAGIQTNVFEVALRSVDARFDVRIRE
jgi:hypothetical protein